MCGKPEIGLKNHTGTV